MREGDDTYRPGDHLDEALQKSSPTAEIRRNESALQEQTEEATSERRREGDNTYRPGDDINEEEKKRAPNKAPAERHDESHDSDDQIEEDQHGSWLLSALVAIIAFALSALTVKFAFLLRDALVLPIWLRVLACAGIIVCILAIIYAMYTFAKVFWKLPRIEQVAKKDAQGKSLRVSDQAKLLQKYLLNKKNKDAFPDGLSFAAYEKKVVRTEGCAKKLRSLSNNPIDDYSDWMEIFSSFEKMQDDAASKRIIKRAGWVFVKTGASPWKIVDVMAVLYHSVNMATELAEIYRRRVTRFQAVRLVLDGLFTVGVAYVAQDVSEAIVGTVREKIFDASSRIITGLLGKVAAKTAEGTLNAMLVYRLGCRIQRMFKPRIEQMGREVHCPSNDRESNGVS